MTTSGVTEVEAEDEDAARELFDEKIDYDKGATGADQTLSEHIEHVE